MELKGGVRMYGIISNIGGFVIMRDVRGIGINVGFISCGCLLGFICS